MALNEGPPCNPGVSWFALRSFMKAFLKHIERTFVVIVMFIAAFLTSFASMGEFLLIPPELLHTLIVELGGQEFDNL